MTFNHLATLQFLHLFCKVYDEDKLEKQLDIAAKGFCAQEVRIVEEKILLSQIFEWYGSDFGSDDEKLKLKLSQFVSNEDVKTALQNKDIPIKFVDYDWKINVA